MSKHDARLVIMLEHVEESPDRLCRCGDFAHWRLGDKDVCYQCLEALTRQIDEYKPHKLCLN